MAEPNEERTRAFATNYRPRKSYSGYPELLGDPQVDAVVNCLPNYLHFPVSLAALRAGKHALCEKPPTLNGAEMRVLHEEAEKLGCFISSAASFVSLRRCALRMS